MEHFIFMLKFEDFENVQIRGIYLLEANEKA